MITTRHNLHAEMVIKALNKGKHVFVEKPLALNNQELEAIEESYNKNNGTLMIGFNRRFSPHIQKIKSLVGDAPMNISCNYECRRDSSQMFGFMICL